MEDFARCSFGTREAIGSWQTLPVKSGRRLLPFANVFAPCDGPPYLDGHDGDTRRFKNGMIGTQAHFLGGFHVGNATL